jgi:uncharacterized protein (TIGR03118 family)
MRSKLWFLATLLTLSALTLAGCGDSDSHPSTTYKQTNLVSNIPSLATTTDSTLLNAWGIAHSSTSGWWVNANGSGVSNVYNGAGAPFPLATPLVVTIPPPAGGVGPSTPTGIVANSGSDFEVAAGQPARFIFVTEDGTVSAWNPTTDATHAVLMVDNSATGAVYKGAAVAANGASNFLYAANFSSGAIDVFSSSFVPVALAAGAFTDPTLPAGYAPFNVANINGKLYVAYAQQNPGTIDDVPGQGHGFVVVYDASGTLLTRLQNGLWFNSPWGITLAPAGFGKFSTDLLVGNFGSGQIAAFDPVTGVFLGLLRDEFGSPVMIDGLWGIGFGNGGSAGPTTTLFFAAGLNGEADGLFGTLTPR